MALNMDEISGGSLTNVAISTATANLNMKVNRYEWQVYQFVQSVLMLSGVETQDIKFRRQSMEMSLSKCRCFIYAELIWIYKLHLKKTCNDEVQKL